MKNEDIKNKVLTSLCNKCLLKGDQRLSATEIRDAINDLNIQEALQTLRELWYERKLKACWNQNPNSIPESILMEEIAIREEVDSQTSEDTFLTESWDEIFLQQIVKANDFQLTAVLKNVPLPANWKNPKTMKLILLCYKEDFRLDVSGSGETAILCFISDEPGYAKPFKIQGF